MQSVVSGLMQGFKEAFASDGTDWDFLPYDLCMYGGGGIGGCATLCGIANGAPAFANYCGLHGVLGADLVLHYSSTEWPSSAKLPDLYYDDNGYGPTDYPTIWAAAKQPIPKDEVLANVIPYSPLCHISISKWCYAAGVNLGTPNAYSFTHKNDRCGKIASEMAGYTAERINEYALSGSIADPEGVRADTAECLTCHHTGSNAPLVPAQTGKMDCVECHTRLTPHSAQALLIDDVWTTNASGDPKDAFNNGDYIQYHISFTTLGAGTTRVKTAKSKAKGTCGKIEALKKEEILYSGTYEWVFSGTVPSGCVGDAKVIVRLKQFDTDDILIGDVKKVHQFTINS
jgi:hypothetical protein